MQTNHPVLNEGDLKGAFKLISNLSAEYWNETSIQTNSQVLKPQNRTGRSVEFLETNLFVNPGDFVPFYATFLLCVLMVTFICRRFF